MLRDILEKRARHASATHAFRSALRKRHAALSPAAMARLPPSFYPSAIAERERQLRPGTILGAAALVDAAPAPKTFAIATINGARGVPALDSDGWCVVDRSVRACLRYGTAQGGGFGGCFGSVPMAADTPDSEDWAPCPPPPQLALISARAGWEPRGACVCACVRVCARACACACVRACLRACVRACMRVCLRAFLRGFLCVCLRACVRAFLRVHVLL